MPVKYVEILEVDPDMFIWISKQFVLRKIKRYRSGIQSENYKIGCIMMSFITYKYCHNIECSTREKNPFN
jgi:hypothetical protein